MIATAPLRLAGAIFQPYMLTERLMTRTYVPNEAAAR
jgi:hypothetical protein